MSDLANAWRTDSDVQPILDRAHHYWVQVYSVSGASPDRFIVTEDEYQLLQRRSVDGNIPQRRDPRVDEMHLFGMRVCRPERRLWERDNGAMVHFMTSAFCRTELPLTPHREVPCPCGEVIWDLSTCTADYVSLGDAIRMASWYGAMPRRATRVGTGTDNDPLPPLDDLDEGLQCCGKPYQTFAEFMAHRRQHGEG